MNLRIPRAAVAAGLAAVLAVPVVAQVQKDWTELRGMGSKVTEPRQVIVQDADAWKALWAKHAQGSAEANTPPAVDFQKESVAAVFLGFRPQPQSVEFAFEKAADGSVVVLYKGTKNPQMFGPTVVAYPFAFRKFPKAEARLQPAAGRGTQAAFGLASAETRETGVRDAVNGVAGKLKNVFASRSADNVRFDGTSGFASAAAANVEFLQLPPPPGQQEPQQGDGRRQGQGNLPPPPGQGRQGQGNLPPPPGQGNLPPPPQQGGGNLPPPPTYRPRPSDPGRLPPPPGDQIGREDSGVSSTGYWRLYRNAFGQSIVTYGGWQNESASARIERGGSETGVTQGTRYTAQLDSRPYRNEYALYYRWIGTDCDPNDTDNCRNWDRQWKYFYEDKEWGRNRHMNVVVEFERDQPIVPWEKEQITVNFDGQRVWVSYPNAAFQYSERGPIIDQQQGTATIVLTAGTRNLRAPEKSKVQASLQLQGGGIQLVVSDARAREYAGERLEIQVVVKWDKPWSVFNPTVLEHSANGPLVITVDPANPQKSFNVPAASKGEYWIDSWSFRRVGSKISNAGWVYQGGGNKVVK